MRNTILFILVTGCLSFTGNKDAASVLQMMYKKYAGNWYKSFSFTQTTGQYKNDSLVKTTTWYENIVFPDKFRIDIGEKADSNAVIYRGDSVYYFRKGKPAGKRYNDEDLTFLLGGMYFYPFDSVLSKIKKQGYDTRKMYETNYNGQPVYVIGAGNSSEQENQLWIDKEKLIVLKFIKYKDGQKEEGIFYDHRQFGKAWSETGCDFYINDKLLQKESYKDCKANVPVNEAIFNPYTFIERE